ncbi:MAG: NADH-quinone oxidoreductase subunit H [Kofleriaceae bacterium]|nr:NADH-quinone oxidoreductase subunit H [Kofleriaceae bacterium]
MSTTDWIIWVLDSAAVKWLAIVMIFVMPVSSLLTWAERRQSAMMQDRLGPNRANIGPIKMWGILHFIADAIKMIFKEDFIPEKAHKGLFILAPILALAPVFIAFAIIPFGPTIYPEHLGSVMSVMGPGDADGISLQVFSVDWGLLFYFAILSLANYGSVLAGWASYNKWALLGGLRASSQMMSYEVAMGLSLMGAFLVMGSLEPVAMIDWQGSNPGHWGIVVQPVAFILFFIAAVAETKRAPFDLPEGEPEIIGYFVEYSGMRWGMFFLAEFIEIVFVSAVLVTVFLGGYQVPFLEADGFHLGGYVTHISHGSVVLMQVGAWTVKVLSLCFLQLAIRWTVPRFRPDQLMDLGWKKLLPFALVNLMITALVLALFQ